MGKTTALYTTSLLGLSICLGLGLAQATQPAKDARLLRGAVQIESQNGQWIAENNIPMGKWIRSASSQTTVALSGSVVRVKQGTEFLVVENGKNSVQLKAKNGQLFVKVQPEAHCDVETAVSDVEAGAGEFSLATESQNGLQVISGDATQKLEKPQVTLQELDKALALDGPDVRRRGRNRKRFTQGEENKGKRIGEDETPTSTVSPPVTETPAYTPTVTPTVTPTTPPQNPPQNPPPQAGGGSPWPWLGPVIAAAGTGTYFLVKDNGSSEPNNAVIPTSP